MWSSPIIRENGLTSGPTACMRKTENQSASSAPPFRLIRRALRQPLPPGTPCCAGCSGSAVGQGPFYESASPMNVHRAVRRDDRTTLTNLLSLDAACVNRSSWLGYTPLQIAALQGNIELVALLLDRGAAIDFGKGWTPLQFAI